MLRLGRFMSLPLARSLRSPYRLGRLGGGRLRFSATQERVPAVLRNLSRVLLRFTHRKFGDLVDDPVEVLFAYRVNVRIGRRVHEIDGVGNSILTGELHGIEVVTQCLA